MTTGFPEIIDVWRMVATQRRFEGTVPLASMSRLRPSLAEPTGSVSYALEFGRDELGSAFLHLRADAPLTLVCQRSLEHFVLQVQLDTRLGLIVREEEEAGLAEGYEPLLVTDERMRLRDVIEDELILAVPLIPMRPGAEDASELVWSEGQEEVDAEPQRNPFAALGALKKPSH